jgi:FkbM family methyltransferase
MAFLRSFLESRTRDWTYWRRLPRAYGGGRILVTPSAGLRYLFRSMKSIDPQLLSLAAFVCRPGDVAWDIGANVGLFSVAASFLVGPKGQVVAVEAEPWLVSLLRKTTLAQPLTSGAIDAVCAAVGGGETVKQFCVARRSRSASFLKGYGTTQTGGVLEEYSVITVSLDWLFERMPYPDVVKIDVEGAEKEVLTGGERLMRSCSPVVLCEVGAINARFAYGYFRDLGYHLFDGSSPNPFALESKTAPDFTVAVPEARKEELRRGR